MSVDANGHAIAYNGTSWLPPVHIDGSNWLESVSCSSSFFCEAVDDNGNAVTFDTANYPEWSTPVDIDGSNVLTSVSCLSAGFCMAVDQTGNAFNYFGGEWVSDRTGAGTSLDSVSCSTDNFCMAVDGIGEALVYIKGTWTASPADIDGSNPLSSVTCLSVDFCQATDQSGNAVSYNGVSWSTPTDIDSTNPLNSVSCAKTSECVAVDSAGNAVFYSNPLQITTSATLPAATFKTLYSTTMSASGGDAPYRWILRGALPLGLHFNRSTGVISGTPQRAGNYHFILSVTDRPAQTSPHTVNTARQTMSIAVDEAPVFTSASKARPEAGHSFSFVVKTNGYPTASLTETGTLPSGLTFTSNANGTATIAGIPLSGGGTYPLTFTATNANGTAMQNFKVIVR